MKKYALIIPVLLTLLSSCSTNNTNSNAFPDLSGPYFGQQTPDSIPEIFAPGIINNGMFTRDIAFSPDGKELLYCISIGNYTFSTMLYTREIENHWTKPEVVPFASDGKIIDFEPAFSPDGNRLYFLSARPDGDEEPGDQDIWYVDRTKEGWGEPVNPGEPLNTEGGEFYPTLTKDGYLYFSRRAAGERVEKIYRSKIYSDSIGTPEVLPEQVNCGVTQFNAFVSPEHDYIIVPVAGRTDAYDGADYYIVFRNADDTWSQPLNMGEAINKDNTRGWSASLSHDGKYLFFMSNRSEDIPAGELTYDKLLNLYHSPGNGNSNVYWMKSDFIKDLRKKAVFSE